eukprot:TRINITY_DN2606_c0_g1_i1.p1 TRINITY_DN2606_c0_g1~~TRINITY_DN2606_c0_g1_i1.p1  ORF type:complete len:927 (-),score=177.81 TRINITY_DN2606_c0_g1_i1:207-2723(-)
MDDLPPSSNLRESHFATKPFFQPISQPEDHSLSDKDDDFDKPTYDIPRESPSLFERRDHGENNASIQIPLSQLGQNENFFGSTVTDFAKSTDADIFDLLAAYKRICIDQIQRHKKTPTQTFSKRSQIQDQIAEELTYEMNTWDLLLTLYKDRQRSAMSAETPSRFRSERDMVSELFEGNTDLRESALIVKWLERSAAFSLELSPPDRIPIWVPNWERTASFNANQSYVSQIDPDAPHRQRKRLHEDDAAGEDMLLRSLWKLVRAGQIDKAQDLCRTRGQHWRAASLGGGAFCHDPVLHDGVENPPVGNQFRNVWKLACLELSDKMPNKYERAIYAALGGNTGEMASSSVCKSWEDMLWSRLKVITDNAIDAELVKAFKQGLYYNEIEPIVFGQKELNIVHEKAYLMEEFRTSGTDKHHTIQSLLMLDDRKGLLEQLARWISDTECSTQLLRCAAHIAHFFSLYESESAGPSTFDIINSTPYHAIISKYITHLIANKHNHLIASYTTHLPRRYQVDTYAEFLVNITDTEQRQLCLDLAESAGLDVNAATSRVVEIIRTKEDTQENSTIKLSDEDHSKIRALGWLTFDTHQRLDMLNQANALARAFLAKDKILAVKKLFEALPKNALEGAAKGINSHQERSVVKEHAALADYVKARNSYNQWAIAFAQRPKPVQRAAASSTEFPSTLLLKERAHQDYERKFAEWKQDLAEVTRMTIEALYGVVSFPLGWLVERVPLNASKQEVQRGREMEELRRKCIPGIFFMLHKVLYETGSFAESIRLADFIAYEQKQEYKAFSKKELQQFLELVRKSAIQNLKAKSERSRKAPLHGVSSSVADVLGF